MSVPTSIRERFGAYERALTVPEVSKILNVSGPMVYKEARSGRMPCFRIGTKILFDPLKMAEWYEKR